MNDDFEYDILNNLISSKPSSIELDDDNEFYFNGDTEEDVMSDDDFNLLLNKLGINNNSSTSSFEKKEEINTNINSDFSSSRIKLEEEILNFERKKFEREKQEWEDYKKMSEISLKSEREEFEKYKDEEIRKINLETKRILDNCEKFRELFEMYIKFFNVSE